MDFANKEFDSFFSKKTENFINKEVSNLYKVYILNKLTKLSKLTN